MCQLNALITAWERDEARFRKLTEREFQAWVAERRNPGSTTYPASDIPPPQAVIFAPAARLFAHAVDSVQSLPQPGDSGFSAPAVNLSSSSSSPSSQPSAAESAAAVQAPTANHAPTNAGSGAGFAIDPALLADGAATATSAGTDATPMANNVVNTVGTASNTQQDQIPPKHPRKKRSDAGKKRKKRGGSDDTREPTPPLAPQTPSPSARPAQAVPQHPPMLPAAPPMPPSGSPHAYASMNHQYHPGMYYTHSMPAGPPPPLVPMSDPAYVYGPGPAFTPPNAGYGMQQP
ncbi:hypothetical protein FKP32DRAFT_1677580 [Trametes sanguinea]|nr:hypothetical protein FKP32DRAFT_1677580 [Trametes sanguinea]